MRSRSATEPETAITVGVAVTAESGSLAVLVVTRMPDRRFDIRVSPGLPPGQGRAGERKRPGPSQQVTVNRCHQPAPSADSVGIANSGAAAAAPMDVEGIVHSVQPIRMES